MEKSLDGCNFTITHYIETLKKYKKSHKFSFYLDSSDNDIILRHDVDFSLKDAFRIAKIENELGICSTFFILLHSELYNPLGIVSSKLISSMLKMGHKIGLHYDEIFFLQTKVDISEGIKKEIELLEQHFDTKIEAAVRHNPSIRGEKIPVKLPDGVVDAMSEQFTLQRKYLSDSVQFWRERCFCNHQLNYKKFQILTHPALWTDEQLGRTEILPRVLKNHIDFYQKQIQENSKIWDVYIKKRLKELKKC